MSIFDRASKRPGGKPKATKPPAPPPAEETTTEPEAPPPTPWAVDGCRACGGTGIKASNEVCGACDKIQSRRGGQTSDDFIIEHDDEGNLTWREKGGDASGSVKVVEEPKVSKPAAARKSRKPKDKPKVNKAVEPEPTPPPTEDEAVEASVAEFDAAVSEELVSEMAGVDGPILYINAMPQNGEYVPFAELFEKEAAELAEAAGVASFYDLDSWQRKSDLAKHAKTVAADHAGEAIVAVGVASQDMKSYLDALLPHAAEVIRGIF